MHPAYSVIFFTTASGAGYGLLALLGLVGISHGPVSSMAFGGTAVVVALALISLGLLSSTAHLGHPERAWRAFSQWRSSWLSREGVAAVITYVPALIFAALWLTPQVSASLIALFGFITFICALLTVVSTGMIYASLPTIRQWRHPLVVPIYLAFAIATGASLLTVLAHFFGRGQVVQLIITLIAILIALGLKIVYWHAIDNGQSASTVESATGLGHLGPVRQWEAAHTSENFVMKEMGFKVGRKHGKKLRQLVMLAMALAAVAILVGFADPGGILATIASVLACLAMIFAVITERWLFFAEARHVVNLYYGASES